MKYSNITGISIQQIQIVLKWQADKESGMNSNMLRNLVQRCSGQQQREDVLAQ